MFVLCINAAACWMLDLLAWNNWSIFLEQVTIFKQIERMALEIFTLVDEIFNIWILYICKMPLVSTTDNSKLVNIDFFFFLYIYLTDVYSFSSNKTSLFLPL